MVWCGVAWRGVAWRGVAWRGVARGGTGDDNRSRKVTYYIAQGVQFDQVLGEGSLGRLQGQWRTSVLSPQVCGHPHVLWHAQLC